MKVLEKKIVGDLQLNNHEVVTDILHNCSPLYDIKNYDPIHVPATCESYSYSFQMYNTTVHTVEIYDDNMFDKEEYVLTTRRGECHIFFPEHLGKDKDNTTELMREFVLKLTVPDNCAIYFHEYDNEQKLKTTPSPNVEFDANEELLGNQMIHAFIETKKVSQTESKCTFFMKSKNCNDSTNKINGRISGIKTRHGKWTVMSLESTYVIDHFLETDDERIWHSDKFIVDTWKKPYVLFIKNKNYWKFVTEEEVGGVKQDVVDTIYDGANATEFILPQHIAYAKWSAS